MNIFLSTRISLLMLAGFLVGAPALAFAQGNDNPTGYSGVFNGNSTTGCSYDPYTANATRTIPDIIVTGAVGKYPMQWSRTMNSRGGGGFFGAGGAWRHSYQWLCMPGDDSTSTPGSYTVYYPDGRKVVFGNRVGLSYYAPLGVGDRFTGATLTGDCYLLLADGGTVKFHQTGMPDSGGGGYNFTIDPPSQIIDPYGLITALSYDSSNKLTQVTEPAGRWLKIYYNTSGAYVGLISEVDAGYGTGTGTLTQIVTYEYQYLLLGSYSWNVLYRAHYSDETASIATYTYQTANDSSYGAPLLKTCSDVRYPGPMKNIAYTFVANGFHGQFASEKHLSTDATAVVSYNLTTHTETRGDKAPDGSAITRTFTYGANAGTSYKPYLLLKSTDFLGHTTTLGYDVNGYVSSIQDANLHTTSFTRLAATGAITRITHPGDGSYIQYFYMDPTTGYFLDHVIDELNHTTQYYRNTDMTASEVDYPDGGIELFSYNGFNQVTSHTMVSYTTGTTGGTEINEYDGRGLLTYYTPPATSSDPNPAAHKTHYTYDVNDHLQTITDPRGNITTLYHNQRGQLTIIQHPDTDHSQVGYVYNPDGTLQYQSVQLDATTSAQTYYYYDDYKRLVTITNPTAHSTNLWYDTNGTTNDYTHTDANSTFVVTPAGVHTTNVYDGNHRLLSRTVGDNSSHDSVPATTRYVYDPVGNLGNMTDPNLNQWIYGYDPRDRLFAVIDPIVGDRNSLGYTVSYTYDVANNRKSEQRANDQIGTYDTYDAMNRLTKMTVHQAPTADAVTYYTWTKAGKLDSMTDPGTGVGSGNVYYYQNDAQNRLITTTYPAGGTTETRTYDFAGNLATFKNRAGNTQTFIYDSRNRETRYDWNDGVTPYRALTYDDASRMTTCTGLNAHSTFVYYDDDLLQSETQTNNDYGDGTVRTVTYTYDADGRRATILYPSGRKYSSGYTPRSEPRTFYDITNGPPSAYQAYYLYDPAGDVISRRLNNYQAHAEFTYGDPLNRLTLAQEYLHGSTATFSYGYDKMSKRLYERRDGEHAHPRLRCERQSCELGGQRSAHNLQRQWPQPV